MKKEAKLVLCYSKRLILSVLLALSFSSYGEERHYIAKIPGEYVGMEKNQFHMGVISINGNLITQVRALEENEMKGLDKITNALHLKRGENYLAIYPGLIDLHNHPKQSLLPLWCHAHGQFANRHEWRDWSVYSHSLGGNMNPWSGNGTVEKVAAFRWSELQAAVLGTTLMQGPRFHTKNFSISHVEGGDGFYNDEVNSNGDFVAKELNVQTPTDLFIPDEMTFIYRDVEPNKTGGRSFHDALVLTLNQKCPGLVELIKPLSKQENLKIETTYQERLESYNKRPTYNKFHALNVSREKLNTPDLFTRAAINSLKNKEIINEYCGETRGKDFDLYFSDYHSSIVSKLSVLGHANSSGIIAHLSEGRRNDPYNKIEFNIAKTMDLISPGMNLVHGIGLDNDDLKYISKNDVGIVWSPFSNLLLYGETFDIAKAVKLGVNISLGSDWTPTGSKSVLEEVKIAKRYVLKNKLSEIINDELLFKMMTENPAKMINKLEVKDGDGRHGVGTLRVDAMASFIAVNVNSNNPYTNIVDAVEDDIAMVINNGDAQYGDIELLKAFGFSENQLDWALVSYENNFLVSDQYNDLASFMNRPEIKSIEKKELSLFNHPKAFVIRPVIDEEEDVINFEQHTGLSLSSPSDIQKILHLLLTTQSRNFHRSKSDYVVDFFPPLISIADPEYVKRFNNFIKLDGSEDEVEKNYVYRLKWRRDLQDSKTKFNTNNPHLPKRHTVPYRLAKKYDLDYDIELGVLGY